MSKPEKIPCINAVHYATIYCGDKALGKCLAAPNPMAVAFRVFPDATHIVAKFTGWKDDITTYDDLIGYHDTEMTFDEARITIFDNALRLRAIKDPFGDKDE